MPVQYWKLPDGTISTSETPPVAGAISLGVVGQVPAPRQPVPPILQQQPWIERAPGIGGFAGPAAVPMQYWRLPDGTIVTSQTSPYPGSVALGEVGKIPRPLQPLPPALARDPSLIPPGAQFAPPTTAVAGPVVRTPQRPLDLSAGEYEDYFAIAKEVLRQLGVLGRDPLDSEVVFFAKSKMNADSVLAHYSNVPEIIERQPGIPYGLSLRGYEARTRELSQAFAGVFPGQRAPDLPGAQATRAERETSLFGGALQRGISGPEFGGTLERFRTERGRVPTPAEFEERRTRQPTTPPSAEAGGYAAPLSIGVASARPAVSRRR